MTASDSSSLGISTPNSSVLPAAGKVGPLADLSSTHGPAADGLVLRRLTDVPEMPVAVASGSASTGLVRGNAPDAATDDGSTSVKTVSTSRPEGSEPSPVSIPSSSPRPTQEAAPAEKPPLAASAVDQVAEAIASRAQAVPSGGTVEFHFRLDPPDLGTVHVYLRATENSVSARLVVTDVGTRSLIESNLPQLRLKLGDPGLSVSGSDVSQRWSNSRQPSRQWQEVADRWSRECDPCWEWRTGAWGDRLSRRAGCARRVGLTIGQLKHGGERCPRSVRVPRRVPR